MTTPRINFISPYLRNPYKNIEFLKFGNSLNEVNDDKWECVVVIVDVVAVVCWCCRCCCSQSNRYPPVCFRHTILLKLTNLHLYKSCYIHTYIYTYLSNSYMYMYAHPVLSPNCFVIIIIILIIIVSQLLLLFRRDSCHRRDCPAMSSSWLFHCFLIDLPYHFWMRYTLYDILK